MIKKIPDKRILGIFGLMLIICAITIIISCFNLEIKKYDKTDYINDWYDEFGNEVDFSELRNNEIITKKLDKITNYTTLIFNAKSINVEIMVDDKKIYETEKNYSYLGKTPGSYLVKVNLSEEYSNKELKIRIIHPYNDNSAKITHMYLEKGNDLSMKILSESYFGSVICFSISFIGFIMIIVFLPMYNKKIVGKEFLYLSVFAFNIGLFMFTDTRVMQLMYGNDAFFHTFTELWMLLLVIPTVLYFDAVYNVKNKIHSRLLCILSMIIFIVCFTLNIIGIKDLHETIFLVHINYILLAIYLIHLVTKNLKSQDKKIYHAIGILCMIIGGSIDIFLLYFRTFVGTTLFTRLGILIFFMIEFSNLLIEHIRNYKTEVKNELLKKLAYYDGLTNLYNYNSFVTDIDKMNDYKEDAIVVMFDVNNLKIANDTYGHETGNKLLINAASSIDKFFIELGKIYRIGGDEFVVLIKGKNKEKEVKEKLKELNNYLLKTDFELPFKISIASGYAIYDKKEHSDMQDVFNLADLKMYKNKNKSKKKNI